MRSASESQQAALSANLLLLAELLLILRLLLTELLPGPQLLLIWLLLLLVVLLLPLLKLQMLQHTWWFAGGATVTAAGGAAVATVACCWGWESWLDREASFLPPWTSFSLLAFLRISQALAALCAHTRRICTGKSKCWSSQLMSKTSSGTCSDALLVSRQTVRGSRTKSRKQRGGICTHVLCLSLLNHLGGGNLHTQWCQHRGSPSPLFGFPG